MVVPFVRDDSALLVPGFDVTALNRAEVAACLFASSAVDLPDGLSIVKEARDRGQSTNDSIETYASSVVQVSMLRLHLLLAQQV
jgi:hypothetical protein